MQALIAKLQGAACGCIPSLLELCNEGHMGRRLVYGEVIPHVDADMAEQVQAELMHDQEQELRMLHGMLLQVHLSNELVIPLTHFEAALRAITLLRFRLYDRYLRDHEEERGHDGEVDVADPMPFVYWYHFLGTVQEAMCRALTES